MKDSLHIEFDASLFAERDLWQSHEIVRRLLGAQTADPVWIGTVRRYTRQLVRQGDIVKVYGGKNIRWPKSATVGRWYSVRNHVRYASKTSPIEVLNHLSQCSMA